MVDGLLASGSQDSTVNIWSPGTLGGSDWELLLTLPCTSWVTSLAVSHAGARLVVGAFDGTIQAWDAEVWDAVEGRDFAGGHEAGVNCLVALRGAIVSGSNDSCVKTWQLSA
jgi:WD40 repeat protein